MLSSDVAGETMEAHKEMRQRQGLVSSNTVCRDVWGIRLGPKDVTVLWLGYDRARKMGREDDVVKVAAKMMSELSGSR